MAHMHVMTGAGDKLDMPVIQSITLADLMLALRRGAEDFWAKPSHYVVLMRIYPIIGIVLTVWMTGFYTALSAGRRFCAYRPRCRLAAL